uniref:Germin-like protein 9-3 n=2 Tax=Nicotiana TaxID=4085 RepID=A0A1S4BHJ4_TOBAC|nr:PREDICTED: germin-like protein 9-3 [Nicotiana sylvestris]XP_016488350.1 PREDICTED: germin-like protein 9-3 [Nicotiana tabacum]
MNRKNSPVQQKFLMMHTALLQFPGAGVNPAHTHPRASEYQYHTDWNKLATAVSAFGSSNEGTVSLPTTLFATGIDDQILAKSFKTDVTTIQKIKAGLSF